MQRQFNRERIALSTNSVKTNGHLYAKKKENLSPYLTIYTKINLKWIIDPSVKVTTTKLLEENGGENLNDLTFCENFLKKTQKV